MANKRKSNNKCTTHVIELCPDNKYLIGLEQAKIKAREDWCDISKAVNSILTEYAILKGIKLTT